MENKMQKDWDCDLLEDLQESEVLEEVRELLSGKEEQAAAREDDFKHSIYFRNDPDRLFAVGSEPYNEFLLTCLQENLNHLRHVETERITFLSLYLVGVGMLLDVALSSGGFLAVLLMGLLLALNYISYTLVRRWNKVFDGHNRIAKRLTAMIDSQGKMEEDPYVPDGWEKDPRHKNQRHHINYYYYFDNKAGEKALAQWKEKHPAQSQKKGKIYIHTADLFVYFTVAIFIVELIFLAIFLAQVLGISM